MPSVSLLFLCIFILHLTFVCGSVLFSQVTNVSNTNLIFFRLRTLFRYPSSKCFPSGGSLKAIDKGFGINSVAWAAAACPGPVMPATVVTRNGAESRAWAGGGGTGATGKTLGNVECRRGNHGLHVASSQAVSRFFSPVRKENLIEVKAWLS